MARMIPARARPSANYSERQIFGAFESVTDRPDWVVFHSLVIRQHLDKLTGEADFVVVVPGKGLVVIEAKNARSVAYRDGEWYLEGTPRPGKNPFDQVDGAVRSIRSYLMREGAIRGDEPFARMVWFTSLGRHHFDGRAPEDLSFFEWELAWADDLGRVAVVVEQVLDAHIAWHASASKVSHDPSGVTQETCDSIVHALTRDFSVVADELDARRELALREAQVMAEQRFAVELVGSNRAVYFDGPAGTGKSYLLVRAVLESMKHRQKTLLTCWNVVMAQTLREQAKVSPGPLAVADLGAVMLRLAGLDAHPHETTDEWFHEQLPALALAVLAEHPERGGYAYVVVDEFQDIAGSPAVVDVVMALAAPDARFMFAGDERQQIMRPTSQWVSPFGVVKERLPDLVHARVTRNCRQAPDLAHRAQKVVGRDFGFTGFRLPASAPGGVEKFPVDTSADQVPVLAALLQDLTRLYGMDGVVVLSPWGKQSLAARVIAGEEQDPAHVAEARWLRANLGDGPGRVPYGSVFKMKGIEVDAVVLTDMGPAAHAWALERDLAVDDVVYVALTRAKYRAVMLEAAMRP